MCIGVEGILPIPKQDFGHIRCSGFRKFDSKVIAL